MTRTYRVKLHKRILAVHGLAVTVALPFLLLTPLEDIVADDFGIPVVLAQLFVCTFSLLGIWLSLWMLTERVELHEDRVVHRACGFTTTILYEEITYFSPKVVRGFRKWLSRGAWISDSYGNAILLLNHIQRLKEIIDYIGSNCESPERRPPFSFPNFFKIVFCFAIIFYVLVILGLVFRFGIL